MIEKPTVSASAEKEYIVTRADLPLCCPIKKDHLWNAHPQVYLPIEETRQETCPYCGTKFILKDFDS